MNRAEPWRVQVVFQGGGAKLAALMAAAEAVEELWRDGVIEVTRCAGASAGAIAACMLATRCPIEEFRRRIKELGPAFLKDFPPPNNRFGLVWTILSGSPLYNESRLLEFIQQLFRLDDKNVFERFDDLMIDVFVTAADIRNSERIVYSKKNNERIADTLAHSCALPFAFRTHKAGGHLVDGGLCENLPSAELLDERENYGEVLGFSYKNTSVGRDPSHVLEYCMALIDTAIANSVKRSSQQVGENGFVYEIPTDLTTFDFTEAFEQVSKEGHQYKLLRKSTKDWLNDLIGRQSQLTDEKKGTPKSNSVVLSGGSSPISSSELMQRIHRIHLSQHNPTNVRLIKSCLIVTAYCLLSPEDERSGNADQIEQTIEILPKNEPLRSFRTGLAASGESPVSGATTWRVTDSDGREVTGFTAIPVTRAEEVGEVDKWVHHVIFFFHPPLEPERSYRIIQSNTQRDTLKNLVLGRDDWVFHVSTQAAFTEICDIIAMVPTEFETVELSELREEHRPESLLSGDETWVQGQRMTYQELGAYGSRPHGFTALGWRASGLSQGQGFGVLMRPQQKAHQGAL